jgi:hypothetical protein
MQDADILNKLFKRDGNHGLSPILPILITAGESHCETAPISKKQDLTVRSNSSKSSGLKSRPGNCPCAPVA